MKKIAIVGASIAGSACAIILERLGFDVTIFEKSAQSIMSDRGAGIQLPHDLVYELIEKNMLPPDFLSLNIDYRNIYTYNANLDKHTLLSSYTVNALSVHWKDLYDGIKQYISTSTKMYEAKVTAIRQNHELNTVELAVNNHETYVFDYCIFADGISSLGRRYLFPRAIPNFTNIYMWRGVYTPLDKLEYTRYLNKNSLYMCKKGYLLIYPIPNQAIDSHSPGYALNWAFYELIDDDHALFKANKKLATQNIIKGAISLTYRNYLYTQIRRFFTPPVQKIILNTPEPFTQAMHDLLIPSYISSNMCLIGDASSLSRPQTASGAAKALRSALSLGEHLAKKSNISQAFEQWNKDQFIIDEKLCSLGQVLSQIYLTTDWNSITKQQMDAIWHDATKDSWSYAPHVPGLKI